MKINMSSPELEEKIKAAETLEDVVKICAEEGIEVTKEQLEAELAQTEGGELFEDALDNVSGGAILQKFSLEFIRRIWTKLFTQK